MKITELNGSFPITDFGQALRDAMSELPAGTFFFEASDAANTALTASGTFSLYSTATTSITSNGTAFTLTEVGGRISIPSLTDGVELPFGRNSFAHFGQVCEDHVTGLVGDSSTSGLMINQVTKQIFWYNGAGALAGFVTDEVEVLKIVGRPDLSSTDFGE